MNREQRERYEQGGLQGTLLFTEGLFFLHGSRFPPWRGGETFSLDSTLNRFKSTRDTPFFVRQGALYFNFLNREQRERREQGNIADTPVSFLPSLP